MPTATSARITERIEPMKIKIATGLNRFSTNWRNTEMEWEELIERLKTTTRTAETQGQFANMSKKQQDNIKDVGGFVGGYLKGGRRKADTVEYRTLITLDADFAAEDFIDRADLFLSCAYCIYSTHKHKADKPRYRLIIPLSKPVKPDAYEATARMIAKQIGIDMFDDTTYQAHRLMYWPSTSIDGEYVFEAGGELPLEPETELKQYDDWHDVSAWPVSSRTVKLLNRKLQKQEDPTTKNGVIGAFCRTYTVEAAMEKFLPGVYTPCGGNRYTYAAGSSSAGAVVYDNGNFLYSNHATDPIGGMLCNAFDLVRVHKFGSLDEDSEPQTPVNRLPSFLAMEEFAGRDKDVKMTIFQERQQSINADFGDDLEEVKAETEEENDDWIEQLEETKHGYAGTINNCKLILEHDKRLKGKVALNDFSKRYTVFGALPWCSDKETREWRDSDDAGLRHYMERGYGINKKTAIDDGWSLVCQANKFHPVQDYLNGLKWDGVPRAETLFVDYLGAEDNEYTRAVSRKTLVSAVARIFHPGVKVDTVTVLVGPQGCGKSQIISRLGGEWFSDTLTTVVGKDAYEQIQGFWIIEIGELAAMKKNEIESIKHFMSKAEDAYRPSYGRRVEIYPRQCVFIGTTNRYEFLRDTTGNRRFWPVDVDPKRITRDMWQELDKEEVGQVWAEAVQMFQSGEKAYIDDEHLEKLAEAEQEKHLDESPLAGEVRRFLELPITENWAEMDLADRRSYYRGDYGGGDFGAKVVGTAERTKVCALEVWCELLGGEKKDFQRRQAMEINDIISQTEGWEKCRERFGEYGNQRGYRKVCQQ